VLRLDGALVSLPKNHQKPLPDPCEYHKLSSPALVLLFAQTRPPSTIDTDLPQKLVRGELHFDARNSIARYDR
jgi:hypothetical protein